MPGIDYNDGVPNGPNNPSQDQPLMLQNTQAIKAILGIDHVTFDTVNSGTHTQVQFSSNPTITPPTTFPTLFTGTKGGTTGGGLSQLFFYSGNADQSANQYTIGSNGSVLLFGGIILKWATTDGSKTVYDLSSDFGLTNFQNGAFGAVASIKSGSSSVRVNLTPTQVTVVSGGLPCFVIMLGY